MVAVFFVSLKTKLTVKSLKLSGRKTACQNHNKFQCFHFVLFSVHGIHPLSLSVWLCLPEWIVGTESSFPIDVKKVENKNIQICRSANLLPVPHQPNIIIALNSVFSDANYVRLYGLSPSL